MQPNSKKVHSSPTEIFFTPKNKINNKENYSTLLSDPKML